MLVNALLQAAIKEAGWTLAQTGAAVNAVGAENGRRWWYDRTAVSHWVAGTVPRKETMPCAVEAFARRLGRPLTPGLLGWPDSDALLADPWAGDVLMSLSRIGRLDMLDRRNVLMTGVYSLAALAVPVAPAAKPLPPTGSTAQQIRETTRHLSQLDDLHGGGAARSAVAAYLTHDVVPQLREATGPARAGVFAAAAQCAYLAGWMAADDMCEAVGQRYYIQAIRLADEAGDPQARATALRSLALQATERGHPSEALDIADAAVTAIRRGCPVRTRAWILGMRAEALAAAGEARRARTTMRAAEKALDAAESPPESEWSGNYRRESLLHQTGTLLARLGDLANAETHLAASLSSRRTVERRSRALIGARLALIQHQRGAEDEVAGTLTRIRDDLAVVSSARVQATLALLPRR